MSASIAIDTRGSGERPSATVAGHRWSKADVTPHIVLRLVAANGTEVLATMTIEGAEDLQLEVALALATARRPRREVEPQT